MVTLSVNFEDQNAPAAVKPAMSCGVLVGVNVKLKFNAKTLAVDAASAVRAMVAPGTLLQRHKNTGTVDFIFEEIVESRLGRQRHLLKKSARQIFRRLFHVLVAAA